VEGWPRWWVFNPAAYTIDIPRGARPRGAAKFAHRLPSIAETDLLSVFSDSSQKSALGHRVQWVEASRVD
jgi:hypothetical protein